MSVSSRASAILACLLGMLSAVVAAGGQGDTEVELPRPEILPSPPILTPAEVSVAERHAREQAQAIQRREPARADSSSPREQPASERRAEQPVVWRFQDVLPLVAVVGVILAAAVLIKRFLPARVLMNGGGVLEVVTRLAVSPKQQLILVRLGRRLVLLGLSAERMSSLETIDDPDQVATLLGELNAAQPDSMTRAFEESFARESRVYTATDDSPEADAHGQVRTLLAKVRRMAGRREVA